MRMKQSYLQKIKEGRRRNINQKTSVGGQLRQQPQISISLSFTSSRTPSTVVVLVQNQCRSLLQSPYYFSCCTSTFFQWDTVEFLISINIPLLISMSQLLMQNSIQHTHFCKKMLIQAYILNQDQGKVESQQYPSFYLRQSLQVSG